MSSIKQVKIGDVTYDLDLLASIVEQKLRESQLFTHMQDQIDAAIGQAQTVFIFRTTNIENVSTPVQGEYPPNNWTIVPSPIRYDDDTMYISIGRMHGDEFISWNPNIIKYWTDPIPLLGKNAGGSYDPTANMVLQYQAYKAASGTSETFFYRNTGSIPPEGYSLTSNLTLQSGQKIYVTSARKKGANWLYWEDGYIWSEPVPLIGETTSTTGSDTLTNNYIYCVTSQYVAPTIPSITPEEMEDASNKGYGYGCDGSLRLESEEVQPEIWFDHPQGVSAKYPYEWVAISKDDKYLNSVLWAKFGSNGQDGDGVEYIFYNGTKTNPPLLIEPYNGRIGENTVATYQEVYVNSDTYQSDDFIPRDWHDNPLSPSPNKDTVYVSSRKSKWNKETNTSEWLPFSKPTVWSQYVAPTSLSIKSTDILFGAFSLETIEAASSEEMRKTPSNRQFLDNGWNFIQANSTIKDDEYIWMITAQTENGNYIADTEGYYWSKPIRITSKPGEGNTSDIANDDPSINFIFTRTTEQISIPRPTFTIEEIEESESIIEGAFEWFDHPQGVTEEMPFEYISINIKGIWSDPSLWSVYGKQGTDGDSVEYIFCAQKRAITDYSKIINTDTNYTDRNGREFKDDDFLPINPQTQAGGEYAGEQEYYRRQFEWTDNPTGISEEFAYQYVSIRKKKEGKWQPFCTPTLWARYGKDGESGVVNGYILHCDNDNVFVDDQFFTLVSADFNKIASAKFTLEATDGEDITNMVVYKIQDSSNLPTYLTPSIDQGNLTYTVQPGLSVVSTGAYYITIGAYINERCIATRKQVIQVADFSSTGVSYKLNVYPNSIKVNQEGKFINETIVTIDIVEVGNEVTNLALASASGLQLLVSAYDENYEEINSTFYDSIRDFRVRLGGVNDVAASYYIFKLQKNAHNLDVETVNIYRDGATPSLGQLLDFQVLRYVGNWTSDTYYYDGRVANEKGVKYIDVVGFSGMKYICRQAHTSTSWDDPNERSYWEEMLTLEPTYISQLVTDYLTTKSFSVKQITILDNDNNACGGIVGTSESGNDVRIWMGAELPNNATFKVRTDGTLEAEKAKITGDIQATSLTVVDGAGSPTIQFKLATGDERDSEDNAIAYPEGTPIIIITAGQDEEGNPIQYIVNMLRLKGYGNEYLFNEGRIITSYIIDGIDNVTNETQGKINYTLKTIQYAYGLPYLRKLSNGVPFGEYYYPQNMSSIVNRIFDYQPVITYSTGGHPVAPPFSCFYSGKGYLGEFWIEDNFTMDVQENPINIIPNWSGQITFLQKIQYNATDNIYESRGLRIFFRMMNSQTGTYWLQEITKEVGDLNELIAAPNDYNGLKNKILQLVGPGSYQDPFKVYKYIQILNLKLMNMPTSHMEGVRDLITPILLETSYVYNH